MKTKQLPYGAGLPARSLAFLAALACLAWGGLVTGCTDECPEQEPSVPEAGRPLQPGETCTVSLRVSNLPDLKEATTKAIPEGKRTVLLDFTNSELAGRDSKQAGWASTEVRTEYGAAEEAATKAMTPERYFQDGSGFRLLVFGGPYDGAVNMASPIENRYCRINGNAVVFEEPDAPLRLMKGKYTFVCFSADKQVNPWPVNLEETGGATVNINNDNDFVYFKQADVNISTVTYTLALSSFVRQCYKLTVKLSINEELGYLLKPNDKVTLKLSGANINTGIFNLKSGTFTSRIESTIDNVMQVNGTGVGGQTFTAVENMLVPAASGSSKLKIEYPDLTVLKPAGTGSSAMDSVFTIPGGTLETKDAFSFKAGNSYTVTLNIGEYVKGILITFQNASGDTKKVLFAPGNLYYDKFRGKWGVGKEQCDYGYRENGVAPNVADSKLVTGNICYYFMYGCLDATIIADTGNAETTEAGGMAGYYTGKADLTTIGRDPCQKLGDGWICPTIDIASDMLSEGNYSYESGTTKTSSDYFPLDENGNRIVYRNNLYNGTYTSASGGDPVRGRWFGLSTNAVQTGSQRYNRSALFLPAAGLRYRGRPEIAAWGMVCSLVNNASFVTHMHHYIFVPVDSHDVLFGSDYHGPALPVRCCIPE